MKDKIFVSIACFMDKDILNTIKDCLEKADNPDNIIFGICLQYDPEDNFIEEYDNHPQVRIHKMHWKEARGAAYARSIIFDLFKEEDYFFQIDCHTRFFDKWDNKILESFKLCKIINPKCIISYYPININNINNDLSTIVNISTVRCVDIKYGIKTHGRNILVTDCPKKSWGTSAAMLFFDKQTYKEIPFDKEIYNGFQFEEQVVIAARYWTYGYDIFTPNHHIISTEYMTSSSRQKVSPPIDGNKKRETYDRLCHIMKLKYNKKFLNLNIGYLGNERTIEDYYKMLGIYDRVKDVFKDNYLDKIENFIDSKFSKLKLNNLENLKSDIDSIIINTINNLRHIETIETVLKNLNYKCIVFNNNPIDQLLYDELVKNKAIIIDNYKLRYHQVFLWQSHYFIWKQMIEENIQKLLILEDTCLFIDNFNLEYTELLEKHKDLKFDILYLGYSGAELDYDKPLYLKNTGVPRLTHSYILTLSGAKKLIQKLNTLVYPIDELMGKMFNRKELNGYRTSQLLTYQEYQKKDKRYELYLDTSYKKVEEIVSTKNISLLKYRNIVTDNNLYDILISINIHENIEFLKEQLENIIYFTNHLKICIIYNCNKYMLDTINESKILEKYDNIKLILNPVSIEKKRWHGTLVEGIFKNLEFTFDNNIKFKYFLVLSSRNIFTRKLDLNNVENRLTLFYNKITELIKDNKRFYFNKDNTFYLCDGSIEDNWHRDMMTTRNWFWGKDSVKKSYWFKELNNKLDFFIGGRHEALCIPFDNCNKINTYIKENLEIMQDCYKFNIAMEEVLPQCLACKFTTNNKMYTFASECIKIPRTIEDIKRERNNWEK